MAQHEYFLDNQTAANYRTDHNNCLAAIVSNNSGDNEPSPTFSFQIWVDTSGATDVVKQRNSANDAWIEIYQLTTSAQTVAALSVVGNITVGGTVDGRDVATDGTKLDGIEASATADQTGAEIKALYEAEANAFTDAQFTKLSGIESNATADQTASEILTAILTVDGIASGLDADLLDGQHGSYYLDRANHTGSITSGNFSGTVTAADFAVTNGGTIADVTGDYGSIKVTGGSTGTWRGYAIEDGAVFMQNDAGTAFGLYDDTNNHWALRHAKNGETNLYHDGSVRLSTTAGGVDIPQEITAVNGTFSGLTRVLARFDVGDGSATGSYLRILKADNNVSDHLQFYNGTTRVGEIGCEDTTWLRINQETAKNIYTPRYMRADGGFYIDGTTFGFTGDATLKTKNGTSSAPSHTFGNDTNTGVFLITSDSLGFAAGGTRRGRLTGDTVDFPGVYNATTSGGTTVKVNSSGRLRRASSSRNVKTNIEPMDAAYATKLLNEAQPVWYRPRIPDPEYPQQYLDSIEENESPGISECEAFCLDNGIDWEVGDKWMNEGENPDHSHWGFIAEDLAEVDPRLCYLNPDTNTWDSVDYEKFTPVLLKLAQMQKEEITQTNSLLQTALTRIEALEAKVTALEAGSS